MTRPNPHPLLARICWLSVAVGSLLFGPALLNECIAKPFVATRAVADVTPPTLLSASIDSSGTTATYIFDEPVIAADAAGFTLTPSGGAATYTLFSGSNSTELTFSISRTIYDDETATRVYSADTGDVTDIAGNELATIGSASLTNNSTQTPPESPERSIESATINSDGDELTVVLSGTATITNATGWSVEFANRASRTLTYTSGSGSDTFVFEFAAVSPSTDGRAPVGTVCLVSYDADTGNVNDMADIPDQSVTNNSTQIPDPDLPQGVPTGELPANWNATADHSPANNAALQELLDGDGSGDVAAGDVISLDADVDYGTIVIDDAIEGDASNWIVIRSDEYTSLPAYGTRVTEADETYMATISRTPSAGDQPVMVINGGDGATGACYIRFIGVRYEVKGSYTGDIFTVTGALTGGFGHTEDELPHHIVWDRCLWTQTDGRKTRDVLRFDMDDSAVVECCFHNLWGGGSDGSTAIRTYNGRRQLVRNCYMESMGSPMFLGGTAGVISDIKYSRNYHLRPSAWNDGLHGTHKTSFETKSGFRVLVEESVFDGQWNGSHAGIHIKADGDQIASNVTSHVTVRGNKLTNCTRSFYPHVTGTSVSGNNGPNCDMLFENNLAYDNTSGIAFIYAQYAASAGSFARMTVRKNTIDDDFYCVSNTSSGANTGTYLSFVDNAVVGTVGVQGNNPGAIAFNWAWGSTYRATNNIFDGTFHGLSAYDNDTSPVPLGTLTANKFPAGIANFGFTDYAADDWSMSDAGPYADDSSTGGKIGYDSTTYDPIWAEVAP